MTRSSPTSLRFTLARMGVGIMATMAALAHRYGGFANPHHDPFREFEKAALGTWAPAALEHLLCAFGLTVLFAAATERAALPHGRRMVLFCIAAFVLPYLWYSTGADWNAFVAGDPAQLAQILADVLGLTLGAALALYATRNLWAAGPASNGR